MLICLTGVKDNQHFNMLKYVCRFSILLEANFAQCMTRPEFH
jgi:hypothetical protein